MSRQNQAENARIRAAGGTVSGDRVDGELAVARALGDSRYKQTGAGVLGSRERAHNHKVIAVPDITHLQVPRRDLLLIGCDGCVL